MALMALPLARGSAGCAVLVNSEPKQESLTRTRHRKPTVSHVANLIHDKIRIVGIFYRSHLLYLRSASDAQIDIRMSSPGSLAKATRDVRCSAFAK